MKAFIAIAFVAAVLSLITTGSALAAPAGSAGIQRETKAQWIGGLRDHRIVYVHRQAVPFALTGSRTERIEVKQGGWETQPVWVAGHRDRRLVYVRGSAE